MNNKNPLVSICVPIYGVEKYIERCAVTLFEQTYENIEYIFVNDCTKDNSISFLEEVISRYPARTSAVRIITHDKNRGLAAARNTTVENSTGEFILHVDSDDYIENNTVELLVSEQQKNDADIVTCGIFIHKPTTVAMRILPHYSSPKELTSKLIGRQTSVNIWGRLIRRSLYIDNDIKAMEGVNMGEDYSVSPILAYYAKEVATLEKPLYHYDCTNVCSYSNVFSVKNAEQTWTAFDLLNSFFKEKEEELKKSLDYGKVHLVVNQMIACCRNKKNKAYYKTLKNKLKGINKDAAKKQKNGKYIVISHNGSISATSKEILYLTENMLVVRGIYNTYTTTYICD
jgi:glycosyltransferase involved in cell wall biosynthesis